jgi:hypothetical protein
MIRNLSSRSRSPEQMKMDKAMCKVMQLSVVFFTRQFLTNRKQGEGSGQFCHSYNVKPDQVLSALIEQGLIVGGHFIQGGRTNNEHLPYPSFRKQMPWVIEQNPKIKGAFEVRTEGTNSELAVSV